jgi:hypothetical protein
MRKTWFRVSWWIIFLLMFPTWFAITMVFSFMQIVQGHLIPKVQEISIPLVSFFAALTDLLVLLLPVAVTYNLQLGWKQRASIMFIFGLGLLYVHLSSKYYLGSLLTVCSATIVSLIRSIRSIQSTNEHWDQRYVTFQSSALGVAEAGAIFICACLPIFGPLLIKIRDVAVNSFNYVTSRSTLSTKQSTGVSSNMSTKKSASKVRYSVNPSAKAFDEDEAPIRMEDGIRREREFVVHSSSSYESLPSQKNRAYA